MIAFLMLLAMAAPTANLPSASDMLRRSARATERFWDQMGSVNCTETVEQAKLEKKNNKTSYKKQTAYDYLVVLQSAGDQFAVDESRMPLKVVKDDKNIPLLVTNGFSTLALIFHPYFQGGFEYSRPEPDQLEGRNVWKVEFQAAKAGKSPTVLRLRDREYPVAWTGTAWLDPATGAVEKIHASLEQPMEDVGLIALIADVTYAPMNFTDDPEVNWLPVTAEVEAETPHQHWRNTHRFSNYKRFSVKTKTQQDAPKTP
jgi:hypothetical protein